MVRLAGTRRNAVASVAAALALFMCATAVAGPTSSTTLYRWVDEDGVVHYSDQPHDGAEKIKVQKPQSFPAAPRATTSSGSTRTPAATPAVAYSRVSITTPANDDVYTNTDGRVDYAVAIEPGLAPGHQIWILLDGQRVEAAATDAGEGTLTGVERGTHTLMVEIVDSVGNILGSGGSVSFTVNQTRVKQKATPH